MRSLASLSLLTLALAATLAGGAQNVNGAEKEGQRVAEREETTEKSAPQVYTYNRGNGVYPSNVIPSYNPSYNPAYNPSNSYPVVGGGSGRYPYTPVVGGGSGRYPYTPVVGGGSGRYPYTPVVSTVGVEAFSARRASPFTAPGSRVVLTEPLTQGGSGWNPSRSEFVATSSGTFFFTFSAVSDRNSHFRMSLRHNGVDVVSAYGDTSGYQMGSQSAILHLNSGDRVYLQLDEGRLYDLASARAFTTFSGFRIR